MIMQTTWNFARIAALAAAAVVAGAMGARASIDMTLTGTGLSATTVGLKSPDGNTLNPGGYWIGLYQFTVIGADSTVGGLKANSQGYEGTGLTVGSQFESVCLSPSGDLGWTEHSYNYMSFGDAAPTAIPAAWATATVNGVSGVQVGIQNAAYLWKVYGGTVTSGSQGAGLAEAMYQVLYDSTGYGTLNTTKPSFTPLFGGDTVAQGYYTSYIADLEANGATVKANIQNMGMLVPNPEDSSIGAGQEFIFLTPNTPNVVPEPTTLISGALLLLPFGASTLRILRKKIMT
jgi:hypothetical protein